MSDFFNSLLNRHRDTNDSIQPRSISRFEENYQASTVEPIEKIISQTSPNAQQNYSKNPRPEMNSTENNTSQFRSVSSNKAVADSIKPIEQTEFNQSTPVRTNATLKESRPSHQSEQSIIFTPVSNSPANDQKLPTTTTPATALPKSLDNINSDSEFFSTKYTNKKPPSLKKRINEQTINKHQSLNPTSEPAQNKWLHQKHNAQATPNQASTKELKQTIRLMLDRMKLQSKSVERDPQSKIKSPYKNFSPLLNDRKTEPQAFDNITVNESTSKTPEKSDEVQPENEKQNSNQQYESLETPSWLANLAAQFNQRIKHLETKIEPVVNVTIGRIEVRAVADKTTTPRQPKKPTGVMSLNDYLKERDSGARK